MERVLIDTNVVVIGAQDYAKGRESPESKILKLALENKIEVIVNLSLLEEYHRIAARVGGKDFAGWFRNVIVRTFSVAYADETATKKLMKRYKGKIPPEDLPHFASCLLGGVDFLISENRAFLKRARGFGFECLTPKEYLSRHQS